MHADGEGSLLCNGYCVHEVLELPKRPVGLVEIVLLMLIQNGFLKGLIRSFKSVAERIHAEG